MLRGPGVVTGTSCGDLLADKFRELRFSETGRHLCKNHRPPIVVSREAV